MYIYINMLETVPSVSIIICIRVKLHFQQLSKLSSKILIFVYFFAFFLFHSVVRWNGKIYEVFFF